MKKINSVCKWFVISFLALLLLHTALVHNIEIGPIIEIGQVGVQRSNTRGVIAEDLSPGGHAEVVRPHEANEVIELIELPSTYQFLNADAFEIRTRDHNIVTLDISVPYRIKPGSAHAIVEANYHVPDRKGTFEYLFQRLTYDTTIDVLRQHLSGLVSGDYYAAGWRTEVSNAALPELNESLGALNVEAEAILIHSVSFRPEYESQLVGIQLNAQNKLIDGAREEVDRLQQTLDNYQEETRELKARREQDMARELKRARER